MTSGRAFSDGVRGMFWTSIAAGFTTGKAAAAAGISRHTGHRWLREAGGGRAAPGMLPLRELRRGRYLNAEERIEIHVGLRQSDSLRAIGRRIGRPAKTVMAEISRNSCSDGVYRPLRAELRARANACRPGTRKLADDPRLHGKVEEMLADRLSPEQVSNRLKLEYPDDEQMRISHETIYQALYVQGKGELRRELKTCLRTGRTARKPQRGNVRPQGKIRDKIMISERPPEVEDRAFPGHWEGDLIIGKNGASAIGTLVERATRFTMLLFLDGDHTAETVAAAMIAKISELPAHLRLSMTWDQGVEMAKHVQIKAATNMDIYFCDPHSPWQRGTNENTNGLLRQYFPKGADLSIYTRNDLDAAAAQLNRRPRKTLGWETPAERLAKFLKAA